MLTRPFRERRTTDVAGLAAADLAPWPLPVRPALTVVLPTYNEAENIHRAVARVLAALDGLAVEILVVDDDSPDRTWEIARQIGASDARVRCLRRVGRRGLAGACIEGILAASAPVVGVIDADLQHDETRLPEMYRAVAGGEADIAVASRFETPGDVVEGLTPLREIASRTANMLARIALGAKLSDPMSGYFVVRRDIVERLAPKLTTHGFKILLDIVSAARGRLAIREVPTTFRERTAGDSKLDVRVALEFLALVGSKLTGGLLSVRFLLFGAVGATGLAVHLAALYLGLSGGLGFTAAQTAATLVAMTSNFFLNNWLTFRSHALRGWGLARGLVTFYAVCGLGVFANVGVASALAEADHTWWVAGLAGALVGVVWNYAANAALTWRAS